MKSFSNSLVLKILLLGVLALVMFVPLTMIREQVRERQNNADNTVEDISNEWSRAQTVAGPRLVFTYEVVEKDDSGKPVTREVSQRVYPDHLKVGADVATQKLHRSIYDVMVRFHSLYSPLYIMALSVYICRFRTNM